MSHYLFYSLKVERRRCQALFSIEGISCMQTHKPAAMSSSGKTYLASIGVELLFV